MKDNLKKGYFNGEGILEYDDGFYHSGCWGKSGPIKGTLMCKQGGYFIGEFFNMLCSNGTHVGPNGHILNANNCIEGKINGICNIKDPSGHSVNIEFKNGNLIEPIKIFRSKLNPSILKCIEINLCTRAFTGKAYYPQIIIIV